MAIQNNITNFFEDLLIEQTATQKKVMDKKLDLYIEDLNNKFKKLLQDLNERINNINTTNITLKEDLKNISTKSLENVNNSTIEVSTDWKKDIERTIESLTEKIINVTNVNCSRDNVVELLGQQINSLEGKIENNENTKLNKKTVNQVIAKNNISVYNAIKTISEDIVVNFSDKMNVFEKIFMKNQSNTSKINLNLYTHFKNYIQFNEKRNEKRVKRLMSNSGLNDQYNNNTLLNLNKIEKNLSEIYPQINNLNLKFDIMTTSQTEKNNYLGIQLKAQETFNNNTNKSLEELSKKLNENIEISINKGDHNSNIGNNIKLQEIDKKLNEKLNEINLVIVKYQEEINSKINTNIIKDTDLDLLEDKLNKKLEAVKLDFKNKIKEQENSSIFKRRNTDFVNKKEETKIEEHNKLVKVKYYIM